MSDLVPSPHPSSPVRRTLDAIDACANIIAIGGSVGLASGFFLWLFTSLPTVGVAVMMFSLGALCVCMIGRLSVSHNEQIVSLGMLTPVDSEAPTRSRSLVVPEKNTETQEPKHNLVCLRCESVTCFRNPSGIFVEPADDDTFLPEEKRYWACVAVIDNQSSRSRKIASVRNVTARLRYKDCNHEAPRGAWLSETDSKVTFYPSRSHALILAVVSAQAPGGGLETVESKHSSARGFTTETAPIFDDKVSVEVILESEGEILEEWAFALTVESSGYIRATPMACSRTDSSHRL